MPQPTSASPVIDLVHLACQTAGDRDLERELLHLFTRQAGQIADRLGTVTPDRATTPQLDLAHTLKGSARAIGAPRVAAAAEGYERALQAARDADIAQAAARLHEAVAEARATVRDLLMAA